MYARHIRHAILAMILLLGLTVAPAQDDGTDGGLHVGGGESGAHGDTVEELRAIHQRLGELIAQLGATDAGGGDASGSDLAALESRVARLETQLRQASAREAQRRLASLQSELEGGGDPADVGMRVEDVRAGLERAYTSAGDQDVDEQAFGRELTTNFDALVEMLNAGEDPQEAFGALQGELMRRGAGEAAPANREGAVGADDGQQEPATQADDAAIDPQVLGPQTYATHCVACHQGNGQGVGDAFPALAGNPFVTGDPGPVIEVVLNGRGGMPSFASLSDAEIAAVITHERTAWDNDAEPVTAEMVAAVREGGGLDGFEAPEEGPNFRPGAAN